MTFSSGCAKSLLAWWTHHLTGLSGWQGESSAGDILLCQSLFMTPKAAIQKQQMSSHMDYFTGIPINEENYDHLALHCGLTYSNVHHIGTSLRQEVLDYGFLLRFMLVRATNISMNCKWLNNHTVAQCRVVTGA